MADLLFHYTSPESLLGILTSRCVWATDIRYLNDSAELKYALALVESKVGQKYMTDDHDSHISYLLNISFAQIDTSPIYVAALSEVADLLSQWRAYCPPTGGFAIGFDRQKLSEYAERHGMQMEQCTYDTDENKELLSGLCDSAYRAFSDGEIDVETYNALSSKEQVNYQASRLKELTDPGGMIKKEVKEIISNFFDELLELAPRFKHPSFSEEREWRLICRDCIGSGRRIAFRSRQSLIIPYVEIGPLEPEVICQVVIGPCPHVELSEGSVQRLAQNVLGRSIEIVHSNTPYRNW